MEQNGAFWFGYVIGVMLDPIKIGAGVLLYMFTNNIQTENRFLIACVVACVMAFITGWMGSAVTGSDGSLEISAFLSGFIGFMLLFSIIYVVGNAFGAKKNRKSITESDGNSSSAYQSAEDQVEEEHDLEVVNEALRPLMRKLNDRIRDLDEDRKKLVKMATIYGAAVGFYGADDGDSSFLDVCRKYKIAKSDALMFVDFYTNHNDDHILFNITNTAQEIVDCSDSDYNEFVEELLSVVEQVAFEDEFPDSVLAIQS